MPDSGECGTVWCFLLVRGEDAVFERCSRRLATRVPLGMITVGSVVGVVALGGCSTVDGDGSAQPGQVAAYQSDVSASKALSVRANGVALCRQSIMSIGMMVRGFNDFMVRLNVVQNYDALGDLDDKARASLIAGSDQIRPKITADTPPDVGDPARVFLDTSGQLGDRIARREKVEINVLATQWTQQRDRVLTACIVYVPNPPAPSTPAAPPASSVAPAPGTPTDSAPPPSSAAPR